MKLKDARSRLFAEWIQENKIESGTRLVPISKLVEHFIQFTERKGCPLPANKISLGKLLSAAFLKVQRQGTSGGSTQMYFLSRDF